VIYTSILIVVEDKHYFIMSPKDVVVGKPRDQGGGGGNIEFIHVQKNKH
jgi:hypothetical protein